jgi:hypothetical protein
LCLKQSGAAGHVGNNLNRPDGLRELHVERTLDEPDSCNQNNQRRAADENDLSIERRPAKQERDRKERADYAQLPGLNAEVETDEREREGTLRQAELLQDIREAQAVDQPE